MSEDLLRAFRWYALNKPELVGRYEGRVLAVENGAVLGVYDTDFEAVTEASKMCPLGSFLVQRCRREPEIQTFQSRVSFEDRLDNRFNSVVE